MRVALVTPVAMTALQGNRTTIARWQRLLQELGHDVTVVGEWAGDAADVLVALHARKSFPSIRRWHEERPEAPLVVALGGTDLYRDLDRTDEVRRALAMADRIVALQAASFDRIPAELHPRVRVIVQSAEPPVSAQAPSAERFEVCVLANLRAIKDPLLTARAARLLPASSRVTVVHAGETLDPSLADAARRETAENPRYRWLGPLPFVEAARLLAQSRLLVLSSHDEGGANVLSEAIVAGVPILSTRIPGSIGLLGADYPGYFPVGDVAALAALLTRAEADVAYLAELRQRSDDLRPRFLPAREREAWRALLAELVEESSAAR